MPQAAPTLSSLKHKTAAPDNRPSAAKRGYGARWQKARMFWLVSHPLCVMCQEEGFVKQASLVDHKKPHKGDMRLFWDRSNWQSLCKPHHDQKTAREDGGFGHKTN